MFNAYCPRCKALTFNVGPKKISFPHTTVLVNLTDTARPILRTDYNTNFRVVRQPEEVEVLMASFCLSTATTSKTLAIAPPHAAKTILSPASTGHSCSCSMESVPNCSSNRLIPNNLMARRLVVPQFGFSCVVGYNQSAKRQVVRMAPEEEKLTRRSPLDFPIEWEKPKPARRPDIFPQFSPMKTPLPPPLPCDPPEEDEEEEEEKKEEGEDPEKEDPEKEESGNSNFQ